MNNQPIGIFDSGVGGLSILLEIKKLLPEETFIFVADQSFMPYGEKTKEQLLERVSKILSFFQDRGVKLVVAACNTATVYTIEEMRQKFSFPVIGTVPVVKTLAQISQTRKAAVFSTPATAKSPYLTELIQKFAPDMEIIRVGGSNLEDLVEQGQLDTPQIQNILHTELSPLVEQGIDALALGCTHYPFLIKQIREIVGNKIKILDSGGAVARRLQQVLTNNDILAEQKGTDEYFTSGNVNKFQTVAEKLMDTSIPKVEQLDL